MQTTDLGGALSSFGSTVDESGEQFVPTFRQGMVGYSIDQFIKQFNAPFPNHLKIDVDGIEDLIIAGAAATLSDARMKSVSIELDASRCEHTQAIADKIEAAGLKFTVKRQSEMIAAGAYKNIFNYQFHRTR